MPTTSPVLISHDPILWEQVSAISAAIGMRFESVTQAAALRAVWHQAPIVLIGEDLAKWVVSLKLPPRSDLQLIARDVEGLARWSGVLRAPGLVLPENSGVLTSILIEVGAVRNTASSIQVLGAPGGVGASTLAVALAIRLANTGVRTALVELDPWGGGIDLMLGAEREPGWRWPELSSAVGHVETLDQLPKVLGVDLLATRPSDERLFGLPTTDASNAVLDSLFRSHEYLVLDGGRDLDLPAGQVVLVVGAGVRATLAARARIQTEGLYGARLVVRQAPGWRLEPDQVSEAVGLGCIGVLRHDRSIAAAAELGDPPGRKKSAYSKQVDRILSQLKGSADGR